DGSIRLWHLRSGRELLRIDEDTQAVTGLAVTPDGLRIVSCSEGGAVRTWDAETGWGAHTLTTSGGWLPCLSLSPDGRKLATGGRDGLAVWDLDSGHLTALNGHTLTVTGAAFTPDSRRLLSGSLDRSLRLWDADSGRLVHVIENRGRGILAVA